MCANGVYMVAFIHHFIFSNSESFFFPGISTGCCPVVLKSCRVDPYKRFVSAYKITLLLLIDFNNTLI